MFKKILPLFMVTGFAICFCSQTSSEVTENKGEKIVVLDFNQWDKIVETVQGNVKLEVQRQWEESVKRGYSYRYTLMDMILGGLSRKIVHKEIAGLRWRPDTVSLVPEGQLALEFEDVKQLTEQPTISTHHPMYEPIFGVISSDSFQYDNSFQNMLKIFIAKKLCCVSDFVKDAETGIYQRSVQAEEAKLYAKNVEAID